MIDSRRGAPPILKGSLLISGGRRPVPTPASAKVQNFRGRTNHGLESEFGRRRQFFGVCRYRFVVEKDLTYFVRF